MLNYICHFVCSDTGHQSPPFLFPPPSPLPPLQLRGVERWGGPRSGDGGEDIKNSLRLVAHQQGRDMTAEKKREREAGGVDNDEEYQT